VLREVTISGKDTATTTVIIEPYAQEFTIPAGGLLEIAIDAVEERVEINLRDDGVLAVWLFEAGEITVWDRATRDARTAARRRRSWGEPQAVDHIVKELRYYARRAAAEVHPPKESERVENRIKWLELTRDYLKRGEKLPPDLKAELLAWTIAEERRPMQEVFIGVLRAAIELGSEPERPAVP